MRRHYHRRYKGCLTVTNLTKPGRPIIYDTSAENLTPEANARRFKGLIKTWKMHQTPKSRKAKSVAGIIGKKERINRLPRARLKNTIIREAREIQNKCRQMADDMIERLQEIAKNPQPLDNVAVAAATAVLDRAYGKPNQTNTNLNVDANGKPKEISNSELDQRIKETLDRVEELTGRTPKAAPRKEQPTDLRKLDRHPNSPSKRVH